MISIVSTFGRSAAKCVIASCPVPPPNTRQLNNAAADLPVTPLLFAPFGGLAALTAGGHQRDRHRIPFMIRPARGFGDVCLVIRIGEGLRAGGGGRQGRKSAGAAHREGEER
jgi:hypothetical protein